MSVQDKVRRRTKLYAKLRTTPRDALVDMLVTIHDAIWRHDSDDYPDAEVNGADVIDAVSEVFMDRGMGPREIP